MARSARKPDQLSEKERLIVGALQDAKRPLSAYDLIERLHGEGVASPPTVYRALKRLMAAGLAHRIESLNAFVSCAHGAHAASAAFAICDDCGTVTEFHRDPVVISLDEWAEAEQFHVSKLTIELHGQCAACCSTSAHPKT